MTQFSGSTPLEEDLNSRRKGRAGVNRRAPLRRLRKPSAPYLPRWLGTLLIAPAVAIVALVIVLPLVEAGYYSLTVWDGRTSNFIGLSAIPSALRQVSQLPQVLENNAMVLVAIPIGLAVAVVVALLLSRQTPGWRVFRKLMFLPVALSWSVVGIVFGAILAPNGSLNSILSVLGLHSLALNWLGNQTTAMPAVLAAFTWDLLGVNVIILLTGISLLEGELLDAARVDGATTFQMLRYVIVPQLSPFIRIAFLTTLIQGFTGIFGLIYVMTSGGPGFSTTTLEFSVFEQAFQNGQFGTAAALGMILLGIMVVLSIGVSRIGRNAEN